MNQKIWFLLSMSPPKIYGDGSMFGSKIVRFVEGEAVRVPNFFYVKM
jgi:hypothetical protein